MKWSTVISIFIAFILIGLQGCGYRIVKQKNYVKKPMLIGDPIRIRPAPFKTGGFPSNETCMAGNYYHVYDSDSGLHGREVWLCCVPIDELLRDSFLCADGLLSMNYIGDPDYLKIRYCHVYDALSEELRLIPVCIPAPLSTESAGEQYR